MGEKRIYVPVLIGIFDPIHMVAIGEAIWLFMWLIHRTTSEVETPTGKEGVVMFGKTLSSRDLADELVCYPPRTIRAHLKRLEDGGYIRTEKKPKAGQVLYILKSKKWGDRPHQPSQPSQSSRYSHRTGRPPNAIERLMMMKDDDD